VTDQFEPDPERDRAMFRRAAVFYLLSYLVTD